MDRKTIKDLMLKLDLNETIDNLAKANSVRCHGQVLKKVRTTFRDGH